LQGCFDMPGFKLWSAFCPEKNETPPILQLRQYN
jgi:hypothetical protein